MNNIIYKIKQFPITYGMMIICIIVYIISFLFYGIEMNALQGLAFGGYNPLYIYYEYEYYRLVTSQFIHFGLMHLIMNIYSMQGIGCFLERIFKKRDYLFIICSSLLSTTLIPYILFLIIGFGANSVSGGLSGVIFGMIGSIASLALFYKNIFLQYFKSLSSSLLMMFFISFLIPSISLSGHICGFIGGFASTCILLYLKNINSKRIYH